MEMKLYYAVTPNARHLGVNVELKAKLGPVTIEGFLGFDALVNTETDRFSALVRFGVAVKYKGKSLCGVKVDMVLDGPDMWHAVGKGSFEILWWDVDFDFDERWGDAEQLSTVSTPLREELAGPAVGRVELGRPPAGRTGAADHGRTAADRPGRSSARRARVPAAAGTAWHRDQPGGGEARRRRSGDVQRRGRHGRSTRRGHTGRPAPGDDDARPRALRTRPVRRARRGGPARDSCVRAVRCRALRSAPVGSGCRGRAGSAARRSPSRIVTSSPRTSPCPTRNRAGGAGTSSWPRRASRRASRRPGSRR